MKKESGSEKKGCLSGCLIVFVIIIVLLAVLAFAGYLNRHAVLSFATDKLGMEVSSVIKHVGTKAETGMPYEFINNAYKIDIPQGDKTITVTTSETPPEKTYNEFIQYYKNEGWEVKKEMEVMEMATEEMKSVSRYINEEIRVAELARNGRKMGLAVTRYNEETVAAVWYTPGSESAARGSEPGISQPEKADVSNDQPEEVSGSDPDDVPIYPGAVRTSYKKMEEGRNISYVVSYAAKDDKDKVLAFYETEMEKNDWQITKKAETGEKKYLEAIKAGSKVRIMIRSSNDYEGYTKVQVATKYASRE